MLSFVIYGVVALILAAALVALLVVVLPDDHLEPPIRDVVPTGLPVIGEVSAQDLAQVRIPVTARGYRMVDTDALLDRLGAEIERRDNEIARLRAGAAQPPGASPDTASASLTDMPSPAETPADDTTGALSQAPRHGVEGNDAS